MKGSFFLGAERTPKFEVREMKFAPLGPHQVLVENRACGICGTDVHIYHGEEGSAEVNPPVVLIVGGGTIGLLMVQLAKLSGAATVVLSEPVEMRRKIGLEMGADAVIDPTKEDIAERLNAICGRTGADVVIECVGKEFAVEQAIKAAGCGANILLFGVPSVKSTIPLPLFDIYKKELRIMGSMINPDTHQRAVNLLNSERLRIKDLITHVYDLEHLEEAIHMQMSSESIKVVVNPH